MFGGMGGVLDGWRDVGWTDGWIVVYMDGGLN